MSLGSSRPQLRRLVQVLATLFVAFTSLMGCNLYIASELRSAQLGARGKPTEEAAGAKTSDKDGCPLSSEILSNQTYAWYGNQWIPPPRVPLYTKEDMLEAFSQFDVLWIGDSTGRRAYATMYALLNSTSSSNVPVEELDSGRVIDVNRRSYTGEIDEDSCQPQRQASKENYWRPGLAEMWSNFSVCRKLPSKITNTSTSQRPRSFDYVRANCYRDFWRLSELTWDIQRYSLIIVGVGLHDLIRPHDCAVLITENKTLQNPESLSLVGGQSNNNTQEQTRLVGKTRKLTGPMAVADKLKQFGWKGAQQMADAMYQMHNEKQPSGVLWRTSGFSAEASELFLQQQIRDLNRQSAEWISSSESVKVGDSSSSDATIYKSSSSGTVRLVDWGAAIWPRSMLPHRIRGDILQHYGLEARLLLAQMATQQVYRLLKTWRGNSDRR